MQLRHSSPRFTMSLFICGHHRYCDTPNIASWPGCPRCILFRTVCLSWTGTAKRFFTKMQSSCTAICDHNGLYMVPLVRSLVCFPFRSLVLFGPSKCLRLLIRPTDFCRKVLLNCPESLPVAARQFYFSRRLRWLDSTYFFLTLSLFCSRQVHLDYLHLT